MGGYSSMEQLAQAAEHELQVVIMRRPKGEALHRIKDSPNLFGIVWQDEPLINFGVEPEKQRPKNPIFDKLSSAKTTLMIVSNLLAETRPRSEITRQKH